MIALVWRYEVDDESRAAFEAAFGPTGAWAALFARGEGFRGQELFRCEDGSYLALIAWRSREDFDALQRDHAQDFTSLYAETEALRRCAHRMGEYEVID